MANTIKFGVGFDLDQASLSNLKKSLQEIQKLSAHAFADINKGKSFQDLNSELIKVKATASVVGDALTKAFNPKLDNINVTTFNNELKKSGLTVKQIYEDFNKAGSAGQIGFQRLATAVLTTNKELKQTKTILDKMGETLGNTIKWNIASSAVNRLTGSVQEAYGYVKALDGSLNDIRIVTGKSADSMADFARQANSAAKNLGTSTTNYTRSALTFYQQGLEDREANARAELSNKVSNVTGLSGEQSAEYVTAVLNGYKVGSEEAEHAMDKLAAVAAITASDLAELSEGMSKTASAAHAMGVSEDQLVATLSTVISTTRQSAATAGTAFKTIYARIADIVAGADEAEISLGEYSGRMAEVGFNVLDTQGHLKDLGQVMEEIGGSWKDLSREQQVYLARTMAGARQYNNLIALFDNWDEYLKAVNVSMSANGALQKQQNIYMESTKAHLNQLKAANEDLFDSFLDADTINGIADALSVVVGFTADWVDSLGGGGKTLLALGSIAATVFSNQIAKGIKDIIDNFTTAKISVAELIEQMQQSEEYMNLGDENIFQIAKWKHEILSYGDLVSQEQQQEANALIQEKAALLEKQQILTNNQDIAENFIDKLRETAGQDLIELNLFTEDLAREDFEDAQAQIVASIEDALSSIELEQDAFDNLKTGVELVKESYDKLTPSQKANKQASSDLAESIKTLYTEYDTNSQELKNTLTLLDAESSEYKQLQRAMANMSEKNLTDNPEKVKSYVNALQKAYENALKKIQDEVNITEQALDSQALESAQHIKAEIEGVEKRWADFKKSPEMANAAKQFTKIAGGIGQVTSAMMSLSNVKNILTDENLTGGEKTLRIIQNLTTAIPMLVMGISSITNAIQAGAIPAFVNMAKAAWASLGPYLPIVAAVVTAIGLLSTVIYAGVKAWNADADAAREAAEQVETLTTRYNELTTAVENFKKEASEYNDAVKALEELDLTTEDYAKQLDIANEKARELIETYGLFNDYTIEHGLIKIDQNKLDSTIEATENKANQAEANMYGAKIVANSAQDRSNATNLGRKILFYDDRTGDYRQFTNKEVTVSAEVLKSLKNSVQEVSKENLREVDVLSNASDEMLDVIITNQDKLLKFADSLEDSAEANKYYAEQIMGISVDEIYGDTIKKLVTNDKGEVNQQLEAQYKMAVTAHATKANGSMDAEIAAINVSGVLSNSQVNEILKANGWDEQIKNDESLARLYAEKVLQVNGNIDDYTYKGGVNKGTLKDETGKSVIDGVSDDVMRHALARQAQIDAITEKYTNVINGSQDNFIKAIHKFNTGVSSFGDKFGADFAGSILDQLANGDLSKLDFSSLMGNINENEFNELHGLDQDALLKMMGLAEQDLIDLGYNSASEFYEAWDAALGDKWDEDAWKEHVMGSVRAAKADVESLFADLQSGDINSSNIAETDEYKDLLNQIANVQDADDDLIAATDLLKQTWLAGTQEYTEALDYIQDKLYAIDLGDLIDQANEAKDVVADYLGEDATLSIEADTEGFENAMNDLLDKEYQIDVVIHTEAENEFNSVSNAISQIREQASLIGDDFIVTGDKIRELNNTFPGILEGMQYLADGTVQLNQDVVQSAMGMAEAEAQADAKSTINKLNNQATLLRAKQKSYQNMANAALILAQGETATAQESADAQAVISSELANLKSYNDQEASQTEIDNAVKVADNSQENGEVVAKNWQTAYQSMADSSYDAAVIAINNMNAVKAGHGATKGTVSVNYPGSTGITDKTSIINATKDALENSKGVNQQEVWASLAEKYAGLADAAGAAANDIEGMLAQIGAGGINLDKTLKGLSQGNGTDKGKDPDHMEALVEEADLYHDIDIQIKQITQSLTKLQKEEKRLTGKELIDNLNKQLEIIQKQRDAYAKKLNIMIAESKLLRSSLASNGVLFNRDNSIANYEKVLKQKLQYVNDLIAQYNAMSAIEQENFKDTVEQAKQDYQDFKQEIEKYNQLIVSDIPQLKDTIEDTLTQEIEIQISKFDMQIQLRIDMTAAEQEWNQFKRKVIDGIADDDLTGKATQSYKDIVAYYNANNSGTGSIQTRTKQVNTILDELNAMNKGGHSSIYSAYDSNTGKWIDDKAHAEEDLKKAYSELMKDLEDIEDLEQSVRDTFLESIDAVNDAFEKQKAVFDFLDDQLNHDIKMIELIYGDEAYDRMDAYYQKHIQNTKEELAAQQESVAYWKRKVEAEKAAIANGGGDKEALKKYEENWKSAISNVNTLLENWAEQVTQKYENTIDNMIKKLNDKISNGLGLDYLNEELSLLNSNADNYLDSINASYAKQKLANKWQDAINNTDSIAIQNELNHLMQQQLDMLEKKGKLTQYDIDRAEKEYEIALKQIALQEAQQNKSKMRLKRDSNGNYSYQFVSDEDSIKNAEQELAAAQNELYNFDKSAYQNNLNEMYATWNEFQQKIADAYKEYAGDQDALNEHIALLQQQYGEKINFLTEQNLGIRNNLTQSAITELAGIYNTDIENFQQMTDTEKNLIMNDLVPQWDSGVQQMIDKFAGAGGFEEVCLNTFENLSNAANDYQTDMDAIRDKNQEVSDEAYQYGLELIEQSQELIQAADEEYERIGMVMEQVNQLRDAYEAAKQAAIEATQAAYNYVQTSAQNSVDYDDSSSHSSSEQGSLHESFVPEDGSISEHNANSIGSLGVGTIGTFRGKYYHDSYGTSPAGSLYSGVPNGVVVDMKNNNPYGIHIHSADGRYGDLGWIKKSQLTGYDTGGYTGAWNNTGRLALLHQKELVLNAKDTSNMLSAVSILRDVVNNIGENAFNRTAAMLSNLSGVPNNSVGADNLEQTVYITASFEGQTEADQIETALNNLVNIAAQRANRNKR